MNFLWVLIQGFFFFNCNWNVIATLAAISQLRLIKKRRRKESDKIKEKEFNKKEEAEEEKDCPVRSHLKAHRFSLQH